MTQDMDVIISEIVKRLVAAANPKKVILFGSHARGDHHPDSDIDLLVIESTVKSKHEEMVRLRRVLRGILVPMDVLVISEEEFAERASSPSNVYYWASKEGKTLYETT